MEENKVTANTSVLMPRHSQLADVEHSGSDDLALQNMKSRLSQLLKKKIWVDSNERIVRGFFFFFSVKKQTN